MVPIKPAALGMLDFHPCQKCAAPSASLLVLFILEKLTTTAKPRKALSAQLQRMGSGQTAGGKAGFWILHFILLGVSELFWLCWQEVRKKKALWQQLCPLSTHFSSHMCAPSTHCHIVWPKAHRGKLLHIYTYIFLNQSTKVWKGRGGATKCANPPAVWVFFLPSFELPWSSMCVVTTWLCCSDNDGQELPAVGPEGNHCSFLTAPTCHWAGNGELGTLGFVLPAVTKPLCEPWATSLLISFLMTLHLPEKTVKSEICHPDTARKDPRNRVPSNLKSNFCKDLKDLPHCLHRRVILYVNACVHAHIYLKEPEWEVIKMNVKAKIRGKYLWIPPC